MKLAKYFMTTFLTIGSAYAAVDGPSGKNTDIADRTNSSENVENIATASRIDAILSEASANGAGYAIVAEVDGEVILSRGYGLAIRKNKVEFTSTTIAQIGSLTKQFTATAVLQLVSEGLISLSDPLRKFLPELEPAVGDITLHQLLTHSAGLAEYCGDDFDKLSKDKFFRKCLSAKLQFKPGSDSEYSNVGYTTLAAVVESVSGQKYETYLRDKVLRPNGLEMTDHFFPDTPNHVLAHGYKGRRDKGNISDNISGLGDDWWALKGAGGMQASVSDMYRWYKVLNGDGALDNDVRIELVKPHAPWISNVAEGYGWYFRSDDNQNIRQMSHSGSDGVFFSYYWHRVDKNTFLYFVGNSGEEETTKVLRQILEVLTS